MHAPCLREMTIAGPQGRLCVADSGAGGLPVLFVHGNGGNRSHWEAQRAHLGATRRAAAFDLRGMGQSARAVSGDYSVEGFSADVAAVGDALGFSRFVLVGHSFGGAVAAAYAGKHPERLAGLVFADSAGDLRSAAASQLPGIRAGICPQSYEKFTEEWFSAILVHATDGTRTEVMRSLRATPREVFIGATLKLYEFAFADALARYPGPKLSIVSYLFDHPFAVHRSVPGIALREIRSASHWLMMDRPNEFNRILDEFLAGLPEASVGEPFPSVDSGPTHSTP